MKKLIILLVIAIAFTGLTDCKKEKSPAPSSTTASTQRYTYYWNYKKAGDPTEYTATGCLTEAEMNDKITYYGAYNVQKTTPC